MGLSIRDGSLLDNPRNADTVRDMKAPVVLFGGQPLSPYAFQPLIQDRSALTLAVERVRSFPQVSEVYLFLTDDIDEALLPSDCRVVRKKRWTVLELLENLSTVSEGQDLVYYAWADCPLLDPALSRTMVDRHLRWASEYTFADGWPYGFAPEILAPSTAAILLSIYKNTLGSGNPQNSENTTAPETREEVVSRDALFQVLQKDINSFDIETEISPVDLRSYRLTLAADSKRNHILLKGLIGAGLEAAEQAPSVLQAHPELLRTLPAFYQIQVSRPCPQRCTLCPYPLFGDPTLPETGETVNPADFMPLSSFQSLLDRIIEFSGDAVIDLSLWGEASLHPQITDLILAVLEHPELSLIIETSGIGWTAIQLDLLAEAVRNRALPRRGPNKLSPLSWIVSLDARNPDRYREIRGAGYEEATHTAETLLKLFPGRTYVQAIRIKDAEDDIEQFYRYWKGRGAEVIIQKYDYFSSFLPQKRAGDISPLFRQPCWHLMRDMVILLDGTVTLCKEDVERGQILGNLFSEELEQIWQRAQDRYLEQSRSSYTGICKDCDEYYTFNF